MPRASALWIILLGAFSITAGRLFGLVELYVIGVAMGIAVVCAVAIVRRPAGLLLRRRVLPEQPSVGQEATVEVRIDAIRNSPLCRVREMVGDDGRVTDIDVSPLRLGASARSAYQLPTDRRGVIVLGPSSLEVVDPLGLAVRRARVADREQVVVLPRWSPIALPHLVTCEGEIIETLRRALMRTGQPDEFRGIHEYAPGDDPRRVNWKATARSETPLVNEYESSSEIVTTVILDTTADEHDRDGFERAVSIVTSFVIAAGSDATRPQTRLRLAIGNEPVVEIDHSNRDDVTRQLALITPTNDASIGTTPVQAGHLNLAVIATGSSDTTRIATIRQGLGRVDALVVIPCSRDTGGRDSDRVGTGRHGSGLTVRLTDFDDFAGQWHRLVRRRRSDFA